MQMQVLIFSWEYPPRKIGQLAEYINNFSRDLVKNKIKTYVITYHDVLTGETEETSGVTTVRVTNPVRNHISFLTWILTLNQEVERAAANIIYQQKNQINLINLYDWHFVPAAVTLKRAFKIPIVYSAESLEDHRSQKANTPYNMAIKSIEWLGFYEANKIIVKSKSIKKDIINIFNVPREKIKILESDLPTNFKKIRNIFNGISGGTEKR
jgi:glycogen(starch) synthase